MAIRSGRNRGAISVDIRRGRNRRAIRGCATSVFSNRKKETHAHTYMATLKGPFSAVPPFPHQRLVWCIVYSSPRSVCSSIPLFVINKRIRTVWSVAWRSGWMRNSLRLRARRFLYGSLHLIIGACEVYTLLRLRNCCSCSVGNARAFQRLFRRGNTGSATGRFLFHAGHSYQLHI